MNKRLNDDEHQNWPKPITCSKWIISWTLTCLIFPQPLQKVKLPKSFRWKITPQCFTHHCVWTGCKREDYNRFHDRNHAQNECGGLCLGGKNHCGFAICPFFRVGLAMNVHMNALNAWLQREDANKECTTNWLMINQPVTEPVLSCPVQMRLVQ